MNRIEQSTLTTLAACCAIFNTVRAAIVTRKKAIRIALIGALAAASLFLLPGTPNQAVAGGGPPMVNTDQLDYAPGDTVQISGSGWSSSCVIQLQVEHLNEDPPCGCGGDGHDPWLVVSDLYGNFSSTWWVNPDDSLGAVFLLTAINLMVPGEEASTTFTDNVKTDFRQSANNETNGAVQGLGNIHWINSIVQQSNSTYYEGMSNFQRTILIDLESQTGNVHTLSFSHQFTKAGIHAYDFLTSYAQAIADDSAALGVGITLNPCGPEIGPPGSLPATCSSLRGGFPGPNAIDVVLPGDPFISKDGSTQARIDAYNLAHGGPGNRTIRVYADKPIVSASVTLCHDVLNGGDTGDSEVHYVLSVNGASGASNQISKLLVEMAGHLAKGPGTGDSWGVGLGSSSISGGPYHFNLKQAAGAVSDAAVCPQVLGGNVESLGSQDNQIKGADIVVVGGCCNTSTGACTIRTAAACAASGGTYQGDSTSCTPSPCLGACCVNGVCIPLITPTACTSMGGVFQGAGTTCSANSCEACLITCPPPATVECGSSTDPSVTGSATCANLQCMQCPATSTTWADSAIKYTCGNAGYFTRTWTCSCPGPFGPTTCPQLITIVDTTAPVINTCPTGGDLGCNPVSPPTCASVTAQVVAKDACATPTLSCMAETTQTGCHVTRTFTIIAFDGCNNSAPCEVTYTWTADNTPPVLSNCPEFPIKVNVDPGECSTAEANVGLPTVTASDNNCDTDVPVTNNAPDFFDKGDTTVTWTAMDDCGNQSTCSVIVTVNDNEPPSITCPADVTVEADPLTCTYDTSDLPYDAVASDSCPDKTVTITRSPATLYKGTNTVTWTASDGNGNESTCTQTVTVEDNTAPVIVCPAAVTVQCDDDVPAPDTTSVIASDTCPDKTVTVIHVGDVSSGFCPRIITRTYRADDGNGNTSTCTQTITVDDTIAPVITCPPNATKVCENCDAGVATATDNCDSYVQIDYSDAVVGTCPKIITRTWTATDDCGNSSSCPQIITCVPPSSVTSSSLCQFDFECPAGGNRDFRLLFTQQPQNWPCYKVTATNPGQFFYNVFLDSPPDPWTVDVVIPYPFVTQGAQPWHAYDGVDVAIGDEDCFIPANAFYVDGTQITLADYTDTNGDFCVGFGDTVLVTVSYGAPLSGFVYLNVHLDYGLKGQGGYKPGLGDGDPCTLDTLSGGNDAIPGCSPAAPSTIEDHQAYMFSVDGDVVDSDTVESCNNFKKNAGVGGVCFTGGSYTLVPGAVVTLKKNSNNTIVGTTTTDADGLYSIKYKHTGQQAPYTVTLTYDDGPGGNPTYTSSVIITMQANKFYYVPFLNLPEP